MGDIERAARLECAASTVTLRPSPGMFKNFCLPSFSYSSSTVIAWSPVAMAAIGEISPSAMDSNYESAYFCCCVNSKCDGLRSSEDYIPKFCTASALITESSKSSAVGPCSCNCYYSTK